MYILIKIHWFLLHLKHMESLCSLGNAFLWYPWIRRSVVDWSHGHIFSTISKRPKHHRIRIAYECHWHKRGPGAILIINWNDTLGFFDNFSHFSSFLVCRKGILRSFPFDSILYEMFHAYLNAFLLIDIPSKLNEKKKKTQFHFH